MSNVIASDLKRNSADTINDANIQAQVWWSLPTLRSSMVSYLTAVERRRYNGYSIPHYHRLVRMGRLLPHTSWRQVEISGSSYGSYDLSLTNGQHNWSTGNVSSYQSWVITEEELSSHIPTPHVLSGYVQEAAAKIYTQGFDVLTFVAELADVKRTFLDLTKALARLDFPRNWKALSSHWLSFRYGWRPLVGDIDSLSKIIAGFTTSWRTRHNERVFDTESSASMSETTALRTEGIQSILVTDKLSISMRGSVTADISIPDLQFNPLMAGWELIPFSFVIDWFVSVGKSIAALSFLTLNKKYAASHGCKVTIDRTMYSALKTPSSQWAGGGLVQTATCRGELEVRTPCSVPLSPHFTSNIDPYKIIDSLGFLLQRLRR